MWHKSLLFFGLPAALLPGVFHFGGFVWNLTPSLPIGIWKRVDQSAAALKRGDHVVFCPPAAAVRIAADNPTIPGWGTCPGGYRPFLKTILGMPGDLVTAGPGIVLINGKEIPNSAVAKPSKGLFKTPITFRIPDGHLWLMATDSPFSFDSRYFGTVSSEDINGIVVPFWTKGGPSPINLLKERK